MVQVSINPSAAYAIASPSFATITIVDDDNVPPNLVVQMLVPDQSTTALTLDASGTVDPDGDALKFVWSIAGKEQSGGGAILQHTFEQPGSYEVTVTALDASGAKSTAKDTIYVGNARPVVRFVSPAHGSFFDWGSEIAYKVSVGESDGDQVDTKLVTVQGEFRNRRFPADGEKEVLDPGLAMMRASTCFACHMADTPSAGPPYKAVALKYKDDPAAGERLAQKVLSGGTGVWGQLPMPPHPQHTPEQIRRMIGWVLSLKDDPASPPKSGAEGRYAAPPKPAEGVRANEGVLILTAAYTDDGKAGTMPRLRGEGTVVLHSRRKKAALYDVNRGMAYIEQVEGETGIVGHFKNGAHIIFRELNLGGIRRITVRAGCFDPKGGKFELRNDSPTGSLLASVDAKPTGEGEFIETPAMLSNPRGLTDVCVIARCADQDTVLGLNWIEFHP